MLWILVLSTKVKKINKKSLLLCLETHDITLIHHIHVLFQFSPQHLVQLIRCHPAAIVCESQTKLIVDFNYVYPDLFGTHTGV